MDKPTVHDIFLRFYPGYLEKYSPSPVQSKVANCIINCKTGAYGANISICEDCGHTQIHYNSCRNRCCPMCQALPKEMWMDKRREDVLDAPYFHVVFTVPQELNPLIYSNQQLLYDTLYHSVSATINELTADTKHLGAKVGYICVLHTWGSRMNYHPHLHTIVLGGGLDASNRWKDKGKKFFFPVKVMSAVFRKYYLKELKELWQSEKLNFCGKSERLRNHYHFKSLLDVLYKKDWIVYTKEAFNGASSVIKYLGRYTHRIAISNRRILGMTKETVTYLVKDYKNGRRMVPHTVKGTEFLRMFLMHVLSKGFVRIRHYGLLSCRSKKEKIELCRKLLNGIKYISQLRDKTATEKLMILYKRDICKCEACGGKLFSFCIRGRYCLT